MGDYESLRIVVKNFNNIFGVLFVCEVLSNEFFSVF